MVPQSKPRFVVYFRVSTDKQGRSGLGLEAQQRAVHEYVERVHGEIIAPAFTEVESGKRRDRPELAKALAHAKRHKAKLLVAKLDRLARNVAFTSALMETGVEFVAADLPEASRFTIHILAAVAEYEAKLISERTKAGLASRRARGLPMGTQKNLLKGNPIAVERHRAKAQAAAERLRPVVEALKAEGVESVRAVCQALNDRGYVTDRGLGWHPTSVARMLGRL